MGAQPFTARLSPLRQPPGWANPATCVDADLDRQPCAQPTKASARRCGLTDGQYSSKLPPHRLGIATTPFPCRRGTPTAFGGTPFCHLTARRFAAQARERSRAYNTVRRQRRASPQAERYARYTVLHPETPTPHPAPFASDVASCTTAAPTRCRIGIGTRV